MKERPILFSGAMVRAIREGKTQTRRVVKRGQVFEFCEGGDLSREERRRINAQPFRWEQGNPAHPTMEQLLTCCPYGGPGDRLWVRESWGVMNACYGAGGNWVTVGYKAAEGSLVEGEVGFEIAVAEDVARRYHDEFCEEAAAANGGEIPEGEGFEVFRWRPSIHMPRWASRITLEVKSIRVERLQAIDGAGAEAEGFAGCPSAIKGLPILSPREHFADGWDHINGKGAWASNPWVWVVEFAPVVLSMAPQSRNHATHPRA